MFLWYYDIYYGMIDTLLNATCGTYVINLNVIIISERKVIILYIEVIQSVLMCHCKEKLFLLPIYNSDMVIMSRGNRNFHLHLFVKGRTLQWHYLAPTPTYQLEALLTSPN
jgi:hypothetical protein